MMSRCLYVGDFDWCFISCISPGLIVRLNTQSGEFPMTDWHLAFGPGRRALSFIDTVAAGVFVGVFAEIEVTWVYSRTKPVSFPSIQTSAWCPKK